MTEFVREPRYVVFKIKDILAYLSNEQQLMLQAIGETIETERHIAGKPPFNSVVVEADWPEFEMVWASIEKRMTAIDTGDTVIHTPTGEEWLVAVVENNTLCCCGWPATLVKVEDCVLTEKATPEARDALLKRLANIVEADPRGAYARARLLKEKHEQET